MHASVAEVGMREQTIPLRPGVSSYNGSNLNTLLYGELPIQVFPKSISNLAQGDALLDRRVGHTHTRLSQGYTTLFPPA